MRSQQEQAGRTDRDAEAPVAIQPAPPQPAAADRHAPRALSGQRPDSEGGRVRSAALFRWGFFAGLGVLASVATALAVYSVRDILLRVLVALFLAVSLDPVVRALTRRGLRRGLAVAIIFAAFLALLAGFLMSVIPPLANQFGQLLHHFPDYVATLQAKSAHFRELNDRYHLGTRLEGVIQQLPARLTGGVVGFTGQLFGALISFLTVVVFTVYFLLDLPRLRRGLVRLFPIERRERYGHVADLMVEKVGDYMIGRLVIAFIGGSVAFVLLELLRVPYPLPLAIFIALLDLIPLVGHPVGSVAAVLVALFTKGLWPTTVLLIVLLLCYQQAENYLIAPRVLRHSVDISPAAVLLAALIGAAMLGVIGALVAIPIAAAFKVVLVRQIDRYEAGAAARQRLRRPHLSRLRRRQVPDDDR